MLELFMGCVVVVIGFRFVAAAISDVFYAGRWGKLPPRMQKRMAELAAAQKAGVPPRPTFGDWLATVWNDVWAAAIEKRKAKAAQPKTAKTPKVKGPAARFFSNWWNTAWENLEDKRKAKAAGGKSTTGTPPTPPTPPAPPAPPTPPGTPATSVVHDDCTYCTGCVKCRPPNYGWSCSRCGTRREGFTTQVEAAADSAGHPCTPTATPQTPDPAASSPGGGPSPVPASPNGTVPPGAIVIPFERKEDPVSGEVTGLSTAQGYAAEMAKAMGDQVTLTEQFVASLSAAGVSGDSIQAAQQAQELSAQASAAWAAANAALQQQNVVKEAYNAVPDAGSREFVTSE